MGSLHILVFHQVFCSIFSLFPSVYVFIYPVCSNFKLLSCMGFLFHSLAVVLNEIINRCLECQSWNAVVIYWSGIMNSNMKSLPFRLLASLDTRDHSVACCPCKCLLAGTVRNAFLFRAHVECHVKSRNCIKLYSICLWVRQKNMTIEPFISLTTSRKEPPLQFSITSWN